jgi:hemerythrin
MAFWSASLATRNTFMSIITWTKECFATQVALHDEEHRHLFDLLNLLHAEIASADRHSIGIAFDNMTAFLAEHFASEERSMSMVAYPDFKPHKLEHDKLIKHCRDLQTGFHAEQLEIEAQTTRYLRDWLCHHIPCSDFKYAPSLVADGLK